MKILIIGLCLLLFLSLSCSEEKNSEEKNNIIVGIVLPLSGHTSNYGVEFLKGVKLAVEEINKNGGVKEQMLEIVVKDNAGDPVKTSQEVLNLITKDKVLAVIGPITSTNSAAAATVAAQYKTPLILAGATSPYVTEIGEYICRICFTDPVQSNALAKFSRKNLKSENVAIIYEIGSSYSEKLSKFFTERFQYMKGHVVYIKGFHHEADNLNQLVDEAISYKPDLLFLPVYYQEAAIFVNYINEIGSTIQLLGGDGWESPEFFKQTKGKYNPDQIYISSHFSPNYRDDRVFSFVKKFEKMFNNTPNALSALGFDAIGVFSDAIKRATTLDKTGIHQALLTTNEFYGATGKISINEKRDAIKDVYILKALNDRFNFETIVPAF